MAKTQTDKDARMNTSISELSLDELKALRAEIDAELRKREVKERAEARKKIQEMAAHHGIDLAAIAGTAKAKYRHPEAPSRTWTGKGRKPAWVQEHLAKGGSLEDLAAE